MRPRVMRRPRPGRRRRHVRDAVLRGGFGRFVRGGRRAERGDCGDSRGDAHPSMNSVSHGASSVRTAKTRASRRRALFRSSKEWGPRATAGLMQVKRPGSEAAAARRASSASWPMADRCTACRRAPDGGPRALPFAVHGTLASRRARRAPRAAARRRFTHAVSRMRRASAGPLGRTYRCAGPPAMTTRPPTPFAPPPKPCARRSGRIDSTE